MSRQLSTSAADASVKPPTKRRWLKPLVILVLGAWLCFHLVNIVGVDTLAQAGWHIQHSWAWVAGLLLLRVLVYSGIIVGLRKHLMAHQFDATDIKSATWMSVRVFIAYELLIGLNLIGHLNDWLRA